MPLDDSFEHTTDIGSLNSSRMVSRGANHRPTSYDMMEPNDQYPNNDSAIDMRGHQVLPPLCASSRGTSRQVPVTLSRCH